MLENWTSNDCLVYERPRGMANTIHLSTRAEQLRISAVPFFYTDEIVNKSTPG